MGDEISGQEGSAAEEAARRFAVPAENPGVHHIGYIDDANRFCVTGWVVDTDDWSRSLTVEILVDGEGVAGVLADGYRDGLREIHPSATGRYVFRYYFAGPLSMFQAHRVSVRILGTDVYLVEPADPIPVAHAVPGIAAARPAGPILLTTCGRTGSTAIMAELAGHPNIVVAGNPPFEIEMGTYYAYALRTLAGAGDPERSLRSDRITAAENRFHIGFNPYFEQALAPLIFRTPERLGRFVHERVPSRLAKAFREIILDFYQDVASDHGMANPLYFAEKTLPERDARQGIRFMFPNVHEILLVRDFRDIVCSSMATKGADFDTVLADTCAAAAMMARVQADPAVLVVRYEDYVQHRAETLARVFGVLGLGVPAERPGVLEALYAGHGTSANAEASIGRWRRDLTAEQIAACGVLGEALAAFGYER